MQIIGRRFAQVVVAGSTDRVVAQYPLPTGCKLGNVFLEHWMTAEAIDVDHMGMYGMAGFIVPVLDPDDSLIVDTLWDNLVPKDADEAAAVFDLDTTAADATEEFEPGMPDWGAVFQAAGNRPREIFRRRKMLHFSDKPVGYVAGTPDLWIPTDHFKTNVRPNVVASTHSHILFGVSSPTLDQTTSTAQTTLEETEWTIMTFVEDFLKDAMKNLLGLIEAGATTPYAQAAAFISKLIEHTMFEETATAFDALALKTFTRATFHVMVPGEIAVGTLTSE